MAQGDIFTRLVGSSGILDDALSKSIATANQHARILENLNNAQLNIANVKMKMLKSDVDSLNVFKRMQSVHKKVYGQMKKNKELKDDIFNTENQLRIIEKNIIKYRKEGNKEQVKINTSIRNQLKLQNEVNKVQLEQMRKTLPMGGALSDTIVKVSSFMGNILKVTGYIISGLIKIGTTLIKMVLAPIKKAFSVFLELQSTVGNLAADIGLTANESRALLNNFASLSLSAMKFGGSMKDVAMVIQQFSTVTNKNRFFSEQEIGQLVELGKATGLGVEGASELAASFDNIGISLNDTIKLTDKARKETAKMNLNTTKVLKTYQGLVQSLTGIGFGKGLTNLTKLAAKAEAIRFDIVGSTKAFSDAFFDPEKAVEASARMQVLGGRFAQSFGDPMQLAFESMTDPSALAEKFAETVSSIVAKDSKGNYFIPPAERKTLKLAAEALGQSYEDATSSAIEQAKIADKMSALVKSGTSLLGFDESDKLALASMMQLNEKGKYEIKMPDGTIKLLENMTDKSQLKQIIDGRKANEQAAIQRLNMMQRFENVVNRFMMGFSKVFDQLFGGSNFESFLQMVEESGEKISKFIMQDILGDNGLADGFNIFIEKAKAVFKKVEDIFAGEGSLVQKIGESLKLVFKDIAIPLVSSILKEVTPFFKTAIGGLLEAIGSALPKWLGGEKMKQAGLKMQSEAIAGSSTLQKIYGKDSIDAINEQITPDGKGSGLQGAALYGKAGYQAIKAVTGMPQLLMGAIGGTLGKGVLDQGKVLTATMNTGKNAGKVIGGAAAQGAVAKGSATALTQTGSKFGLKALGLAAKRIPVLGALASAGFAIHDIIKGDFAGAGLNVLSGLANVGNIFVPGVGSAVSMGIDGLNAARQMGAFNDGVIYKDGSYAKFAKGDMVQFIDQAAMERAAATNSNNTSGSNNSMQHTGVITIKSDDGKVVTWDQMYAARDLIGSRLSSIGESYENGFGNYQNPYKSPIQPLL